MTQNQLEIIKIIGDSSRICIIKALYQKSRYVEELAQLLDLSISTISFHLKKMEKVGIVKSEKEQYYVNYFLNRSIFDRTLKELLNLGKTDTSHFEKISKDSKSKVINTFFKDGNLTKFPVQHKKRLIIIEEFIKKFDPAKRYLESEIDDLINESYEDHCTIRRIMVDEKYLFREKQIYWINYEKCKNILPELIIGKEIKKMTEPKKTIEAKNTTEAKYITVPKGDNLEYNNKLQSNQSSGFDPKTSKTQIKRDYKNTLTPMGVYQIKNIVTGRVYLGSSLNVAARLNRFRFELKYGTEWSDDLINDAKEYGENNLVFEVLEYLKPKDDPKYDYKYDLKELEEKWRAKLL
jgi:DNA-binding HxlR family transcriptional regulator